MQENASRKDSFVWTKFGVEAGEPIERIIARKEEERLKNGGVFLWGVGNNIGPSISSLARTSSPEVLFSPIISSPRPCDEDPGEVFVWTQAESIEGVPFSIPRASIVTSRGGSKKRFHYALVCHSDHPLRLADTNDAVYAGSLRNLVSGRQVGSSQVTSVVEVGIREPVGRSYQVAMRLKLVAPYFVRLLEPVCVPQQIKVGLGNTFQRNRSLGLLSKLISSSQKQPRLHDDIFANPDPVYC